MAEVGQIYRDTYFDGKDPRLSHRTIRIMELVGEKAMAETVTDVLGAALAKPRKTRISLKTLRTSYVLVQG